MLAAGSGDGGVPGWVWLVVGGLVVCLVLVAHIANGVLKALPPEVQSDVRTSVRNNRGPAGVLAVVLVWTITLALYNASLGPVSTTASTTGAGTDQLASSTDAPGATTGVGGDPGATGTTLGSVGGTTGATTGAATNAAGAKQTGATSRTTLPRSGTSSPVAVSENVKDVPLYSGAANTRGFTANGVKICGHAPLTLGAALNTKKEDLLVFWSWLNDRGGVYGRKFDVQLEDDQYTASGGVPAAQKCAEGSPFMIFGALGSDVIPPVRVWAEQSKELYMYGFAPKAGTSGFKYSYSAAMASEDVSRTVAKVALGTVVPALAKDKGAVGVMWRNSSNVQPARDAFVASIKAGGGKIVADIPIQQDQGQYTQEILALRQAGAATVFVIDDALAQTNVLKQGYAQNYRPNWLTFSFNLQTQTLGADTLNPPIYGANFAPAYSKGDFEGPFGSYASEMKEFETAYAKYSPNTDLSGPVGDIAWQSWVSARALVGLFEACGPACTRNRFAGLMSSGFNATIGAACPLDFRGDPHHGGVAADVMTPYLTKDGKYNWKNAQRCVLAA
jgi:ABC-type branched-subunit amino acid transport system substrate-binding protein